MNIQFYHCKVKKINDLLSQLYGSHFISRTAGDSDTYALLAAFTCVSYIRFMLVHRYCYVITIYIFAAPIPEIFSG